jgi:outer membrane protein W
MRLLRPLLLAGTALLALAPEAARAQAADRFVDSWFVGAKGGLVTFTTPRADRVPAPTVGFETMITRQRVALYLSADQAFFNEKSAISPSFGVQYAGTDSARYSAMGDAELTIRDMRRYQASLFAFPKQLGALRPYLGVGLSMNNIVRARQTAGGDVNERGEPVVPSSTSTTTFVATVGAQAQVGRAALFGQAAVSPGQTAFAFSNHATYFLEGGIRYSIGPSRERVR